MPSAASFNSLPTKVRGAIAFVVLCGVGAAASHTPMPLPWLLAPLIGGAILSTLGLKLGISDVVRKGGQLGVGLSIGILFSGDVALRILSWWYVILGTCIVSLIICALISRMMARLGGIDTTTAFFCSMPGGLAEMAGFATTFGANPSLVSLVQSLRIFVIVLTLPLAVTLSVEGHGAPHVLPPISVGLLALACATCLLVGTTLNRLKVFNAWLLGGLMVGITIALLMPEPHSVPPLFKILVQVMIGSALGARFDAAHLRRAHRLVPAALLAIVVSILAHLGLAALVSGVIPYPVAVLATAPGGIAEMSLTAAVLNLQPEFVTAWQLGRIIVVATLTAPLFNLVRRMETRAT
ncbi:AbrB family transcriptional regulator [Acuticoccus kandeliae]|uniref:AbrB family transcriptional regulator n=1 Tax=Acuticoccus kandeliae TaxID=2073160 RepID=UPI0013002395|nr:AbrB family transcriptional regulator [Acuticoccus kandeliae]